MIETLGTTLIVIFCVLIFLAQAAGIASFVMLILQGKRIKTLESKLAESQAAVVGLKTDVTQVKTEVSNTVAGLKTDVTQVKTEVLEGQFQLANLTTEGIKATTEYIGKASKAMTDSLFDVIEKNTEDVLKLNTENAQKVYDSLFVNIQMMNSLMSALGYRPSAPVEPGLQDPKRGQNYSAPPAPSEVF